MVAVHTVSVDSSALHVTDCAIDGMVFTRGSKDDWDNWANIVEDDDLKWDNMIPYMLKVRPPFNRSSLILNPKKN